jgi:hypothetical protein
VSQALRPSATGSAEPVAPAVLDIEASGFGQDSYPIEVGFVLADGETFCCLIRPAPGWTHWDAQAEQVHGISQETVLALGRDPRDVARLLNDRLRGLTLYCDGWAHDYVWLNVLFETVGMRPSFKLDNLRRLLTEREASDWAVAKQQVANEMGLRRHRASSDAKLLQRTLMRLRSPGATPNAAPNG